MWATATGLPRFLRASRLRVTHAICGFFETKNVVFMVQFHPECATVFTGNDMLVTSCSIFVATGDWSMDSLLKWKLRNSGEKVWVIRKCYLGYLVGRLYVAGVLVKKQRLNQPFVFSLTSLLRKGEGDQVHGEPGKFGLNIIRVNAQERFLSVRGVSDPNKNGKLSKWVRVRIRRRRRQTHDVDSPSAQGTLYTDIIESGTKTAQPSSLTNGSPEDMHWQPAQHALQRRSARVNGAWHARLNRMAPTIPRTRTWHPCAWGSDPKRNLKSSANQTPSTRRNRRKRPLNAT